MSHPSEAAEASNRPARSLPTGMRKRFLPIGIAGAMVIAGIGVHAAFAAPSADALIAEVYGGGGNSGRTPCAIGVKCRETSAWQRAASCLRSGALMGSGAKVRVA